MFFIIIKEYILKKTKTKFEKTATKVTYTNIVCNTFLSFLKILVGIVANSQALISDAINSISDVFSAFIVIIGVKLSSKKSDKAHPYGHERFECVAAIILAVCLFVTGLFVGHTALENILEGKGESATIPAKIALLAAIITIVVKECMFWYTRRYAKTLDSSSLMGIAWDNRSDVFSGLCVLLGIIGARLGVPMLDSIASLIVCVFIAKAAYDIFNDAIGKMIDKSCPAETEDLIIKCTMQQNGVLGVDLIQTRIFGNKIYVDIEISADPDISLKESHDIAESVHNAIETEFENIKHIMVHVNPYKYT